MSILKHFCAAFFFFWMILLSVSVSVKMATTRTNNDSRHKEIKHNIKFRGSTKSKRFHSS